MSFLEHVERWSHSTTTGTFQARSKEGVIIHGPYPLAIIFSAMIRNNITSCIPVSFSPADREDHGGV
jgi:hypothetical protein